MATVDGAALKIIRDRTGWSAKDFAKEIGVSPSYLSDIESGYRNLKRNPALRKRMAETLNVPTSMIERPVEPEQVS